MGYSACFIIDVNMFWIFILFFFFPCSHKQLCLIKFLIFHISSLSLFILFVFFFQQYHLQTKHKQSNSVLVGGDQWQVNVALHRRQRFNLPSRPASFPLPQAAGRADPQPAVATGFADDPFVVVNV